MYYHHSENVDEIFEIELMIFSQMHTKNLRILRSLEPVENEDNSFRTIVNS